MISTDGGHVTVSVTDPASFPRAPAGSFEAVTDAVFVSEPQWTSPVSLTPGRGLVGGD